MCDELVKTLLGSDDAVRYPSFCLSLSPTMILGLEPHRNTLAISLIDPIVFLRGADFSRGRHENAPPSILRGLLTLCLTKPTRISSIEVELIGQSLTTWSEGLSASI